MQTKELNQAKEEAADHRQTVRDLDAAKGRVCKPIVDMSELTGQQGSRS